MLGKFLPKENGNKKATNVTTIEDLNLAHLPQHVAIIMDGNGRWAEKRGLPRIAGHHEGMKTVKKIVKVASKLGIKILTLYAFSTENWKRPKIEVEYLMKLPQEFLNAYLPELVEENVKVQIIGNKEKLPASTIKSVDKAVETTQENTGLHLNFALNYGSRDEILQAVRQMMADAENEKLTALDLDESLFSSYLMTSGNIDPDLLIRTSGEKRLSNFMLWQLAYAELLFTDVLWPDFKEEHFISAISEFQNRGRRFGGL